VRVCERKSSTDMACVVKCGYVCVCVCEDENVCVSMNV